MAIVNEKVAHAELTGGTVTTLHSHAGGSGGPATVRTTGDVSNATTSFADVTGLSFALAADTKYIFQFFPIFQSSATTTGIGFAVNGPTSPTVVVYETHIPISLTSVTQGAALAYNSGTASASVPTANSNLLAVVEGVILNGANAGTLILRFKAETTGTVKVMAGSCGLLYTVT